MFNQAELLKTFLPLSQGGRFFLEVLLIGPVSQKVEGRGFFNDPDFLIEACTPLAGRWNFCLSPFAYAGEDLPSRQGYNQFDRNLVDSAHQEKGVPHSLTLSFHFKPDLWRELEGQAGGNPVLQIIYLVDGILGRLGLKTFLLEYAGTSMTARFIPAVSTQHPLTHLQFFEVTRKLQERIEKEMHPAEHKKLGLAAAALGKAWEILPGTPISSGTEKAPSQIATTAGVLAPAEENLFQRLFEEVLEGKKAKPTAEVYAQTNLQGLSQGWEDPNDDQLMLGARMIGGSTLSGANPNSNLGAKNPQSRETSVLPQGATANSGQTQAAFTPQNQTSPGQAGQGARTSSATGGQGKPGDAAQSSAERLKQKQVGEIAGQIQQMTLSRWHWPLLSQSFHRLWQGPGCGQVIVMQCDNFGAESAFQFLMQCADSHAREAGAQTLVFSKPHLAGDIALFSLARHLKQNPLHVKSGTFPDGEHLARQYIELFPQTPLIPPCAATDTWDHILRYLEHDYLVRQKKTGAGMPPLCILVDNASEFQLETPAQTHRQLSHFKTRLRDFNATLWILQPLAELNQPSRQLLDLADYLAVLDFEGSLSDDNIDSEGWEFSFPLDPAGNSGTHDLSMVRISFQAHGSHRKVQSTYTHFRQAGLFRELTANATSATSATKSGNPTSPDFTAHRIPNPT